MGYKYEASNGLADPFLYERLREYSKRMRENATLAENHLWSCLRGKKLGVKFRRQHVIGEYIADFICMSEMLIVEVDGEYHQDLTQAQNDLLRTEKLNAMGYRVLRFTNEQVLYELETVLQVIKEHIRFKNLEEV